MDFIIIEILLNIGAVMYHRFIKGFNLAGVKASEVHCHGAY